MLKNLHILSNFNKKRAKLLIMMHFRSFSLTKKSQFTRFQCVKFFCLKIGSCNFFDKFQVCQGDHGGHNGRGHDGHGGPDEGWSWW